MHRGTFSAASKFNDPCFFKAVVVNALGAALLVRVEAEGVCSAHTLDEYGRKAYFPAMVLH